MKIYSYPQKSDKKNSDMEITDAVRRYLCDNATFRTQDVKSDFTITRNKYGKPYIEGIDNIFVSVAHDKDLCLVAVSDKDIGIDLERQDRCVKNPLSLAKRYFCEDEVKYLIGKASRLGTVAFPDMANAVGGENCNDSATAVDSENCHDSTTAVGGENFHNSATAVGGENCNDSATAVDSENCNDSTTAVGGEKQQEYALSNADFTDMWVKKEALSKLVGKGIACMKEKSVFSPGLVFEKIQDYDGYIAYIVYNE